MNPCSTCRPFRDCPGFNWYSPGDIVHKYCRQQCIWIIREFLVSRGGFIMMARDTWVIGTDESGYTEAPQTSHSLSSHAPYELVCQIVGELSSRIEATGKDGQILVLEVEQGGYLSMAGNNALIFISGKRKRMAYADWLKKKRWRNSLSTKMYQANKSKEIFRHRLDRTIKNV